MGKAEKQEEGLFRRLCVEVGERFFSVEVEVVLAAAVQIVVREVDALGVFVEELRVAEMGVLVTGGAVEPLPRIAVWPVSLPVISEARAGAQTVEPE